MQFLHKIGSSNFHMELIWKLIYYPVVSSFCKAMCYFLFVHSPGFEGKEGRVEEFFECARLRLAWWLLISKEFEGLSWESCFMGVKDNRTIVETWSLSLEGQFKFNIDRAVRAKSGLAGFGGVVHNGNG